MFTAVKHVRQVFFLFAGGGGGGGGGGGRGGLIHDEMGALVNVSSFLLLNVPRPNKIPSHHEDSLTYDMSKL